MKRQLTYTVPYEFDGKTVNDFLRRKLQISGSLIKKMKQYPDGITVNGVQAYTVHKIKRGDIITVTVGFDDERSENIPPIESQLDIVYEDDDILVLNKPADMPTHPSLHHYEDSLASAVMYYYESQNINFVFRCVNRLDKGTSGLCVVAKHAYAHEQLKKQLHTDDFVREYLAIVCGKIEKNGFVEAPISRVSDSVIKRMVCENGDYAYTDYFVEKVLNSDKTLIRLRLKTGRTHQIRVHMSYIGHALVGDFLYGEECDEIARPALHSARISLLHPITRKRLTFNSDLPDDMKSLII